MDREDFLVSGSAVASGQTASGGSALLDAGAKPAAGTSTEKGGPVSTGGTRLIPIAGGKYRVWTKRVGDSRIKVLTLHGGPGFSHLYLECFEDFLPPAGIEFYYYDQLGSLFSDNPDDPSLWTLERYTEEVEEVRKALGLENFYLYGHSWGGMLAYEYALKYAQPLRGMIVSNMVPSIADYGQYVNRLREGFPPDIVKTLAQYEAKGDYEVPEYQQIIFEHLYARHLCRVNPWPPPLEVAFKFANNKIYNYIQGPNEFVVTGTMQDWDRWADLKKIQTRTLVMGATYDTMDPQAMRRVAREMPHARAAISERGSHLTMYDDQDWYFRELIGFLKENG
jgi:proline iminopeptidase